MPKGLSKTAERTMADIKNENMDQDVTFSPPEEMFTQEDQTIREVPETGDDIEEVYRQVSPVLEPETKDYIKSRGYSKGDMVCRGKGKAIRGFKFGGCK